VPGGNVIAKPAFDVTTYPFSTQELYSLYGEEFVKRMNEKRIGAKEFALLRNFRGWGQPDAVRQMPPGTYPIKACGSRPLTCWGQAADTVCTTRP
jgi:hypothetical protein